MYFHILLTHKLTPVVTRSVCIQSRDLSSAVAAIRKDFGDTYFLELFRAAKTRQEVAVIHQRLAPTTDLEFIMESEDDRKIVPVSLQPEVDTSPESGATDGDISIGEGEGRELGETDE